MTLDIPSQFFMPEITTCRNAHQKLLSWPILITPSHIFEFLFHLCLKAAAWAVMGHIQCISGAGTQPSHEQKVFLWSRHTLIMCNPLILPQLSVLFYFLLLFLLLCCVFARLLFAVTKSLSDPLSLQHFSLPVTVSPTCLCLSWPSLRVSYELACFAVCVPLACLLTFTKHVLFEKDELRLTPLRQRAQKGNKKTEGFYKGWNGYIPSQSMLNRGRTE